jgi:hypothetical protein
MQRIEILKYIRANNGVYGSEIPDDDDTTASLASLVEEGLVRSESARMDDYFYLTKAGKRACCS